MIHLLSAAKSFSEQGRMPSVVFRPTSLSVPGDRRVAILGQRRDGKSVLLRLLGGLEALDQGEVISTLRLSPVINSGGLLHPQLTVLDNIRFLARVFGTDPDRLAISVDSFTGIGFGIYRTVKTLDSNHRKVLEAAITLSVPFDCYLIDSASWMGSEMLALPIEAARRRNAGAIFATSHPWVARQFADFAVVICEKTLRPFGEVEEAIRFYEQQAGYDGRERRRHQ